ncbi:hypothetical protein ABMA27_015258 [Loxostege sticticalis]|uniref:Cuticle protein n=1 Tax=Loxostege sticticalis TaxID=481309 RepID=A0ABR3I6X8_LOXSC
MILKITVIGLISAIALLQSASGASYSKVFVQSGGPGVVPVEYYNYGAPPVISSPQIARLSAPPVGSALPVQTVSNVIPPCVSPCVIPSPGIASVAPNAKIVTYDSPNVPVVVAPNQDNGYEYSYVVYDENTGDKKAQRELSDGAVVRGEYSFLQPDGFVREVQYTADDLTGFNVVIKRILPEAVGEEQNQEKTDPAPCPIKHEELKVEAAPEKEEHDHGHEGHDHEHDEPTEHKHDVETPTHEAMVEHVEVPEPEKEPVQEHEPVNAPEPEQAKSEPEQAPEPEAEQKPEPKPITEAAHVEKVETPVTHQSMVEVVEPPIAESAPNLVVSYEEVLRCLQAKGLAQRGLNYSPLTYIILPASNRPC